MKLYVARHGETEWNKLNKVLGRTDIPLNDTGLSQANELAEKMKEYNIDLIITSTLCRAAETGKIVAEKNNIPYQTEARLMEQNFGIFEGLNRNNEVYQEAKRKYASRYEDGESFFDVVARIYPFIEELKEKYSDKNVLLVTHGGICRIINSYFYNMENEEFSSYVLKNCEVKEYEL